jgi:4-amino-4-deoxy-L-arabinose transferase-like glycosyltransferase
MLQRLLRQWPWLLIGGLVGFALVRHGVTWQALANLLPQLWLYTKGVGLILLLVTAALGIGRPLLALATPTECRAEAPVFAAAVGLGVISLLTLFAGVLRLLYPATAWALLFGGSLLAVIQLRQWKAWARSVDWHAIVGPGPHSSILYGLLLLATTLAIFYALTANGLTPPLLWDEAAYHLALPKIYAGQHRIVNVPFILYSNQPFNTEMLFVLALMLRSEVMASLVSLAFALLLSAGVWLFAREEFGRRAAFLASVLFWTTPAVFRLSGTTLVEMPLTTYTFLSVWAFWRYHTHSENEWSWLVVAAVMAGLAAGTKLTGAAITIILVILLVFYGWRRHRPVVAIASQAALLTGGAFILALPWYAKSYAYTGNPFWPFLNNWFGGQYWDALGDEYHYAFLRAPNLPMTLGGFLSVPWRIAARPSELGGFALGLLAVIMAPLALLYRPYGDRPTGFLGAFVGLYYVGWFFMTHQTRFLVPIVPLMCVLAGFTLDRLLARRERLLRIALPILVVTLILLDVPGVTPHLTKQWGALLPYLVGAESRDDLLTRHSDATAVYVWANNNLPTDAKILLMPYENRGYFLDREYLWANPISQRVLKLEEFPNGEALWRDLKDRGITHLIDSQDIVIDDIPYWPAIQGLLDELRTEYAIPI